MIRTALAAVAALCALACPAGAQNQRQEEATTSPGVRLIHADPAGQPVDVAIGKQKVFTGVQPGTATPLMPVSQPQDGEVKLTLLPQGGGQPIVSEEEYSFDEENTNYTILVSPAKGEEGKTEIVVLDMERLEPGAKGAQVTLINAIPDVRALDLFLDDKKLHAGVNYQGINGPDLVEAGPHRISVATNDEKVVLEPFMPDLTPGQSYTAIGLGTMLTGARALLVEDATGKVLNGAAGSSDAATTTTAGSASGSGTADTAAAAGTM